LTIRVVPGGGGGGGNAWLVEAAGFTVLMDNGLSLTELAKRLHAAGSGLEKIDAVVFTHQHADHIHGAGPLLRKRGIPYWCSRSAFKQSLKKEAKIPPPNFLAAGEIIELGPFSLEPVPLPHDADETFALRFSVEGASFAYASDLGYPAPEALRRLAGVTLLAWEFNHDGELLAGFDGYPEPVKARIAGHYGHLSNAQAQAGLEELLHRGLRHLWLVHLSEKTNRPSLALRAARESLAGGGFTTPHVIAEQHSVGKWISAE